MSLRRKNTFNHIWLSTQDSNCDNQSEYISPDSENDYIVRCNWFKKTVLVENQEKAQILQHACRAGHRAVADALKGRKKGQVRFL